MSTATVEVKVREDVDGRPALLLLARRRQGAMGKPCADRAGSKKKQKKKEQKRSQHLTFNGRLLV